MPINEKFGFLSNFPGFKVTLYKKGEEPVKEELTDNPPVRKRHVGPSDILTSDEDSEPEAQRTPPPQKSISRTSRPQVQAKPVLNRILESSSSNGQEDEKTYCSKVEAKPLRRSSSEPSLNTKKTETYHRDTVIGSFSDEEEMCSRISEIHVSNESKRQQNGRRTKISDTVVGTFSEISASGYRPLNIMPDYRKQPRSVLRDTIVQSSSEDEADEPQIPLPKMNVKPPPPKKSLPETVVDFSDSLAELSLHQDAQEPAEDSDEESELEVISVLDSEEESILNENDQPPILKSDDTFYNCSSSTRDSIRTFSFIQSQKKTGDSDSTLNKFFNNPPMITDPDLVVTHSEIRRLKNMPKVVPMEAVRESPKSVASIDRFKLVGTTAESGEVDDIDIPPTEPSEAGDEIAGQDVSQVNVEEKEIDIINYSIDENANQSHANDDSDQKSNETDQSGEKSDDSGHKSKENEENSSIDDQEHAQSHVVPSQLTQQETQVERQETQSTEQSEYEVLKFTANIRIALKINLHCGTTSEETSSDESQPPPKPKSKKTMKKTDSPRRQTSRQPPSRQETPKKQTPRRGTPPSLIVDNSTPVQYEKRRTRKSNNKPSSTKKERQAGAPGSGGKLRPTVVNRCNRDDDFKTPCKTVEHEIDEDAQSILNSLYGDAWKTPQLLKSCKTRKVREDLRKSMHANNIDNLIKSLPQESPTPSTVSDSDKTSSQISPAPKSSTKKKPQPPTSSTKKTPLNRPAQVQPKSAAIYLEICDSDTPSDDSSDEEINANDTWNASSDEEYKDEDERIKKRLTNRLSRMNEPIIFVPDDSVQDKRKTLDDLLERFEYKKPPGMGTPRQISKKKLFTHSHYDDEVDLDELERKKTREKENKAEAANEKLFVTPLPVPKRPEIKTTAKTLEVQPPAKNLEVLPPVRKTPVPKAKLVTPKSTRNETANKFGAHSFLKSLDCETSPIFCDPEALTFRKNYKSKKSELTDRLFKLYNEKVFDNSLAAVPVVWNKKLLNTAGRCNNTRKTGVRQSQLELSDKVLTSADRLRCTLIHEMCHAATWILQGENGHGASWKKWAAKANRTFPELPKINVCHNYIIEYKYAYVCTSCNAKYQAHSKSKKVENIRCSICKGSIELFMNKKDKDGEVVMTPVQSKAVRGFPKFVQLKYKDVKRPGMTHKDAMHVLSDQFKTLTVEQKQNL